MRERAVVGAVLSACAAFAALAVAAGGPPKPTCVDDHGYRISGVISGFAQKKTIYVGLYSNKDDFEKTRPCQGLRLLGDTLPPDSIHYAFDQKVPAGNYVIAGFQDLDGDGKMTTGLFGIPKEPYRVLRPNYGMFGPKFDQCTFRLDSDCDTANLDFHKGKK